MDFDYGHIGTIKPDLILWYGWSKIIPNTVLKKYYSVMLHPSPLPLYRGGSPIQNQIINGEEVSAVTLFKMDEGIDTGDIISQLPLSLKGDLEEIFARITELGTNQTRKMIADFPNLTLKKQNNSIAKKKQNTLISEEKLYLRYEDTIVVTEDGNENFTDFLPSELDDLESLVREKGMLQSYPKDLMKWNY